MLEQMIAFAGKRVALLSDAMARGNTSLHTRGRHAEANMFFEELQRLRKLDARRKRKTTKAAKAA